MSDNALEVQQVRKKTLARNRKRKQRLAASAQDRSTQQRKRMRLLGDRETPARWSARLEAMRQRTNIYVYTYLQIHFNIATYTFQLHALSREAFCTMCIPSYASKGILPSSNIKYSFDMVSRTLYAHVLNLQSIIHRLGNTVAMTTMLS